MESMSSDRRDFMKAVGALTMTAAASGLGVRGASAQQVPWRRPCWRPEWAIPSRRADQGRDCGAAEIQRVAQNAPRWRDMNT